MKYLTFLIVLTFPNTLLSIEVDGFNASEKNSLIHEDSGAIFPEEFIGFKRGDVEKIKQKSASVRVNYYSEDIKITFSVYPRSMGMDNAEDEFTDALSYADSSSHKSDIHQATCTTISREDINNEVFLGALSYLSGEEYEGEWLMLAASFNHFYKVRASFPWTAKNINDTKLFIGKVVLELIPEVTNCKD